MELIGSELAPQLSELSVAGGRDGYDDTQT